MKTDNTKKFTDVRTTALTSNDKSLVLRFDFDDNTHYQLVLIKGENVLITQRKMVAFVNQFNIHRSEIKGSC